MSYKHLKNVLSRKDNSNTILRCFEDALYCWVLSINENYPLTPAFKTDHSPVSVIISYYKELKSDTGLWKFNNSLISYENFTKRLKKFVKNLKGDLNSENSFDDQVK